jgi:topoisomerase-4 subunit B
MRPKKKNSIIERLESDNKRGKIQVTRFKGLGEMNPGQLRDTVMNPDTRRLVRLMIEDEEEDTDELMDMLLAKKRSGDRKKWLESKGDLADF